MTVDSRYVIKQYTADGGDTYTFDTESIGETAIQVWIIRDGVREQITSSYYDLTFDNSQAPIYKRGTVTFTMELPVVGDIVSIERSTPIYNELTLVDGEPFPSEQFEYMMDRICFIQQEIEGHYCDCRAICTPPTVSISILPPEIVPEATTVYESGIEMLGFGVNRMIAVSPNGSVVMNYWGTGGVRQTFDFESDSFPDNSFRDNARSGSSGSIPLTFMHHDDVNNRWWILALRNDIRATGFTYSADDDMVSNSNTFWGDGGTQDISQTYTNNWVGKFTGQEIHMCADNDNPCRFWHWPNPPNTIAGSPTNTGPEDPDTVYIRTANIEPIGSQRNVWQQHRIGNYFLATTGGEGVNPAPHIAFWHEDFAQLGTGTVTSYANVIGNGREPGDSDGTEVRLLWSCDVGGGGADTTTIQYQQITEANKDTPPYPLIDYTFPEPVRRACIHHVDGIWRVCARSTADPKKAYFTGTDMTEPVAITLDKSWDGDEQDRQIFWHPILQSWLLAYTSNDVATNEYVCVKVTGFK